jgi:RNA polymerase subunit RPABC4/transcription elongation factor Spt4
MKRNSWFLLGIFLYVSVIFTVKITQTENLYPTPYLTSTNPVASYEGEIEDDLSDIQVPIPMKDRVPNRTGVQCVWSSIETIARYCGENKLYDLTYNDNYKSYASPKSARKMFETYEVKYEITTSKNDRSLLIKGCVIERRGCTFGVPGHVMVIVHYDEEKGVIKYINNSDPQLKVRTWTMQEFNKRWDGWVMIVYAENDRISHRQNIPIKDRNGEQGSYDKNYVVTPK